MKHTIRRGFTLLEMMAAIAITGVVVAAAYGAIDAGISTRARLGGELAEREEALVARGMLAQALRHGSAIPGESFAVTDGHGTRLTFQSRGIEEPFGASRLFAVEVTEGPEGVGIAARALEGADTELHLRLRGVRGIEIDDAHPGGLLQVNFRSDDETRALAPIVVRTTGFGLR